MMSKCSPVELVTTAMRKRGASAASTRSTPSMAGICCCASRSAYLRLRSPRSAAICASLMPRPSSKCQAPQLSARYQSKNWRSVSSMPWARNSTRFASKNRCSVSTSTPSLSHNTAFSIIASSAPPAAPCRHGLRHCKGQTQPDGAFATPAPARFGPAWQFVQYSYCRSNKNSMAVNHYLPRSLKFRMTAVVTLLVLAATAVVTSVALRQAERDMQSVIGDQQYALLSAAAARIDDQIEAKRTLLAALADAMPAEVRADARLMPQFIASHPTTRRAFFNIVTYGADGMLLYSARDGLPLNQLSMLGQRYFDDTLKFKRGMISPPFKSRLSGLPVVLITQPVLDREGRVELVLSGSIDLSNSHFFDQLGAPTQGRTGYMFIMTADGRLLDHPDRSRLLQHVASGAADATAAALAGFQGWTEARDVHGSAGIYSYQRLKTTDWILGARFPTDEAFAPLVLMRQQTMLSAAVVAVVTGALAWLAILALLRPLGRLRAHIADIRAGRAGIEALQRRRRDEIGELSAAFHELMAEREVAQARTRDSESLIRTILDRAPDAFVSCDQAGTVTEWNAQAEQTFGWRRDEAVGRDLAQLIIPAEQRNRHWAGMARFAATGHGAMINQRVKLRAQHRDGHAIPVELSLGALRHGGSQFVTGFLHDISKRLEHEEQIAASEKRARMIADNMPALIAYIDRDLRYRFTNSHFRELLGVEPKSVLGKTIPEVFGQDFYLLLKDKLDAVLRGKRVQYEREGRETGRPLQLMAHMIPDFDADGGVAGFYLMTLDISERKNAELTQAASEQRLKLITDHLPVLIAYLDQERRIQFVNATVGQWFGRDPAGLIGRNLVDCLDVDRYRASQPIWTRPTPATSPPTN